MKIEKKKMSMQIVDYMKQLMKEKKLQPGDKVPTESQMIEMFGVSRTPIREALSVLEASGIIASRQGGRSVVLKTSIEDLLIETKFDLMDESEIIHVLEARAMIEVKMTMMAAKRRTEQDLKRMKAKLMSVEQSYESGEIGHEADIDFHLSIAEATHNPVLIQTLKNMLQLYEQTVQYSLMKNIGIVDRRKAVLTEHHHIYTMIEKQDASGAKKAMEEHLVAAMAKFM